ncbi:MAG: hypothetical protein J6D08_01335 [Lachnospiraceae bacterium]|nr:hypothetical protein [Lachnospiraceae bacterium]
MKIGEAQKQYQAQRYLLQEQKKKLLKQKEELEKKANTTVNGKEIYANEAATLELSIGALTQKFEENQEILDSLSEQYTAVWNAEVTRQQGDAMQEYGMDMAKLMEVARRIAKGAKVPATDEKKLMEYSMEVYLCAKNMAMLNKHKKKEEYDSLWEDEEDKKEYDPQGKAENAEANIGMPDMTGTASVDGVSDMAMTSESTPME